MATTIALRDIVVTGGTHATDLNLPWMLCQGLKMFSNARGIALNRHTAKYINIILMHV